MELSYAILMKFTGIFEDILFHFAMRYILHDLSLYHMLHWQKYFTELLTFYETHKLSNLVSSNSLLIQSSPVVHMNDTRMYMLYILYRCVQQQQQQCLSATTEHGASRE